MEDTEAIDLETDNYSIEDLLKIFNIVDPTMANVTDVANSLIAKMTNEAEPELVTFFTEARDKVLEYLQDINKDAELLENDSNLFDSQWEEKKAAAEKLTSYFIEGSRTVIEDKQIPTAATGSKAPIISTHIITIDSQYRPNILPYTTNPLGAAYNTKFLFNLSSPISKAISMRLYSYQIPTSWYGFNAQSGNTFFLYNGIILVIPDGNYTPSTLVAALQVEAAKDIATQGMLISYNATTNRISITNNDILPVVIIFYIQSNVVNFSNCGNFIISNFQTLGINKTLGWLLGFRTPADPTSGDVEITLPAGATSIADVSPDTYGPKYFVLNVEEYSNRRLTRGMYNITNSKHYASISIPDFYKTIRVACKLREGSLTQAEQYTINAITTSSAPNNNITGFNNALPGPTSAAALAVIPLTNITTLRPEPYVRFGADLMANVRNYSAPTPLTRLSVRLTDDTGNLVNLYDNDWSFSLIIEERLN